MKKKLFVLYPYYWPLYKAGGPVQSLYNLVNTFSDNAQFYFISRNRDIDNSLPDKSLSLNEWNVGLLGENIYCVARISMFRLRELFLQVKPDLIMINGIFNASTTLPGIIWGKWLGIEIVISPRGMLQPWALKRGRLKKRFFLFLLKCLLKRDERWHATNIQEKEEIVKIFGKRQVVNIASNIPRRVSAYAPLELESSGAKIKMVFGYFLTNTCHCASSQ